MLLALFWWLAVSASFEKSQTSDELPHIAAGYAYDRFGDFRMHPENGVLPQRVFGLPALADRAQMPIDPSLWHHSTYWQVAWDFFYSNHNLTDWLVLRARALNALFGVGLGALIFFVARSSWGACGALLALSFYVLAPNFLAHGALATSDMAAAFFLTLAPCLFWRHLHRRDLVSGAVAALVSGLTLTAKFNGLLLAPIYLLLGVAHAWLVAPAAFRVRSRLFASNLGLAGIQAVAATAVIWACFDFRFSARGAAMPELISFAWQWPDMLAGVGWKRPFLEFARHAKLLPEAWLYGLTNVLAGEAARPAFFAGEHSLHGWKTFFPTLFLIKTPLATLAAFLLAAIVGLRRYRRLDAASRKGALLRALPVVAPAFVVAAAAFTSHLNIGDRHILALYPVLFAGIGVLASKRLTFALAVLALAGTVCESFWIRPHYLASFNVAAGGPKNAYRLVADSSLDWGQDLPALQQWLAGHRAPTEKFYLGYFGSAWAPHYGVRPNYFLPTRTYVVRPPLAPYEYEPGIYAVSATLLNEIYSDLRGPWSADREAAFVGLRERLRQVPVARNILPPDYELYDRLRFARLCKYLQTRQPDAYAGFSILIFRLTPADLRRALDEPVTGGHRLRLP